MAIAGSLGPALELNGHTEVREHRWPGGRATNRMASVEAAIDLAADLLSAP
jgi:hypothetical protein